MKKKLLLSYVAILTTSPLWSGCVITYTAPNKLNEVYTLEEYGLHHVMYYEVESHTFSNGKGVIRYSSDLETIPTGTFYGCTEVTSITLPNTVTTIEDYAFMNDSLLVSITIPNCVQKIGRCAFANCTSLLSFATPDSLISIGDHAFQRCESLKSIVIPKLVTEIGWSAFLNCLSLDSVTINAPALVEKEWNEVSGFGYTMTLLNYIFYPHISHLTIGEGITKIGENAFMYSPSLKSVALPQSLTSIGDLAFCSDSNLHSVVLPDNLTYIGTCAFASTSLPSITIPKNVQEIGYAAFENCISLSEINVDPLNKTYSSIDGVLFDSSKKNLIEYPSGNKRSSYEVPDFVDTIKAGAFYRSIYLQKICLGPDLSYIGEFCYCDSIKSVVWNVRNDWQRYEDMVIRNFGPQVEEFVFGDSVRSIPHRLCEGMNKLKTIIIPNNVKSIVSCAFSGCTSLDTVSFGQGLVSIFSDAFLNCSSLRSLSFPNSLKTIGGRAFYGCSGMTSVTCERATPPECDNNSFSKVDIPLYVPAGSVDLYAWEDGWKQFKTIKPINAKTIETTDVKTEPSETTVSLSWPAVNGASTYEIYLYCGDIIICTYIFNSEGFLVSVSYAPSRSSSNVECATETAQGWSYTIKGLKPGTTYSYKVDAKNDKKTTINSQTGSFSTMGGTTLNSVNKTPNEIHKFLQNGQLFIQSRRKLYNTSGNEIK